MRKLRKVGHLGLNPFKEDMINMKGKFRILGNIGLALFLVCALTLAVVPAAKVEAATAVTEVWVEFPYTTSSNESSDSDSSNVYMVHFKPATALVRGVDTVTVTFPDGSVTMGGTVDTNKAFTVGTLEYDDVEWSTNYDTRAVTDASWKKCVSDPVSGGYRVMAKAPIDVAAGTDVWLKFDTTDGEIESGSTAGTSFKVYVGTSKDTTGVLSSAFVLAADPMTAIATTSVSPATAGAAAQYIFTFDPNGAMTESEDTLTIQFPVGTVLPSSISASNVEFSSDGSAYTTCGVAPTVDQDRRMITATTPIAIDDSADNTIKFKSAAGIINPTGAASVAEEDYLCMARTSDKGEWLVATAYHAITAGAATKLIVGDGEIGLDNTRYSDDATMINTFSSAIYLTTADANGNAKDPGSITVTPSSSSSTGTFYISASQGGGGAMSEATTITVSTAEPASAAQEVYYKDSTAGTHTLTFSHASYTDATTTITVCPAVSLYDSSDQLVSTYGPTTTATAAETATSTATDASHYGSDYINDAITAAMPGDTVKLGDGIYEVDNNSFIDLNEKVTLTSVNGASSTTLRNTAEIDKAIQVGIAGTAANPVIIDGLTFQRLRSSTDIDCVVRDPGYDYLTVRNCIFNNIEPDEGAATEGVIWIQNTSATLTSLTISDNTFNNCVTAWPNMGSNYDYSGCIILDFAGGGNYAVTGVTISGNTLTDCGQYGITIGGKASYTGGGYVTNNTITNGQCAINVFNNSAGVNITGNTITDAYSYGVYVEGATNTSLVIKNNTITGCAGEYYIANNTTSRGGAIVIEDATSTTDPVIQYNTITGSGSYAIKVDAVASATTTAANCKYNWFGDATGPSYTALTGATVSKSNPNGTGDSITDLVTYYPWLHKSLADVVADNASYQASTMKLVVGWNTLSTPVKLIAAADSIDELIPSGMTIGYYYDGGWVQITTGKVLNACDAVYAKMSAATYVLLKFDAGAFTTPSKDLAAGWNLISLASLDATKNVNDTMACVDLTAAGLPGWSQVISPTMNVAQTDLYGATETAWAESAGEAADKTMQPGLGYWAYMQNAATLAGFEITPIAPDLD